MLKYILPAKKIWIIIGLLSLICVKNINSSNKGCPPIFEVFEYQLKIEKEVINNVCHIEYLDVYLSEDNSGVSSEDNSGLSSGDNSGTNPRFTSICSFICDYYIDYCPQLAKKIHSVLVYDYDDFRWKYTDILTVCKNWDVLFYTPELSLTSISTEHSDTIEVETSTEQTTTPDTTTKVEEKNQSSSDTQYSKGGTIGIITVIGILMGMVAGVSIFLFFTNVHFTAHNLKG